MNWTQPPPRSLFLVKDLAGIGMSVNDFPEKIVIFADLQGVVR
jgi:hypothetical protein